MLNATDCSDKHPREKAAHSDGALNEVKLQRGLPVGISRELQDKSVTIFWKWGFFRNSNPIFPPLVVVRLVFFTDTVVAKLLHLKAALQMGQVG